MNDKTDLQARIVRLERALRGLARCITVELRDDIKNSQSEISKKAVLKDKATRMLNEAEAALKVLFESPAQSTAHIRAEAVSDAMKEIMAGDISRQITEFEFQRYIDKIAPRVSPTSGGSIDDASPTEWDEVHRALLEKDNEVKMTLENAQSMADVIGREVYIVDTSDGLQVRTEARFREHALEVIHPTGD